MSDCGSLPWGFLGRSYFIPDYGIAPFTSPHCEERRYSCSYTVGGHEEPCLCRGNSRIRSQAIKRGGGLWAHHWFLREDCVNSAIPGTPCSCRAVLNTDVLFWVIVPFPRAEDRAQTRLMLGEQFANGLVMRLTDQWERFFFLRGVWDSLPSLALASWGSLGIARIFYHGCRAHHLMSRWSKSNSGYTHPFIF